MLLKDMANPFPGQSPQKVTKHGFTFLAHITSTAKSATCGLYLSMAISAKTAELIEQIDWDQTCMCPKNNK